MFRWLAQRKTVFQKLTNVGRWFVWHGILFEEPNPTGVFKRTRRDTNRVNLTHSKRDVPSNAAQAAQGWSWHTLAESKSAQPTRAVW